ncbi:MAG TPA: Zn-dependent hydrolase [Gaiellaceae bacterium]|nr:Zn-dependent hydrolase [Gaiellaceae bacterium]
MDREGSAQRIQRDIETLAGPDYTLTSEAIRRYAYTDVYRRTLGYFTRALEELGFTVEQDPVGTLVARNRPKGEPVFGIGSHCDSNRNGGRYDGTMGVVTALEVCRLNAELGYDLPLQLISFLEEEGSGFGQMLLGSRIIAQRVGEEDLREHFRSLDDGRSFWDCAADAGYSPERWRECSHVLDDLTGWVEMHIEQARVLQDTANRIGLVTAIAGYVHADVAVGGRGDHAGATPMDLRLDPTLPLAETIAELERLARAAGQGTVGTVGEIEVDPGIINAIAARVRFSLDIRGPVDDAYRGVARDIAAFAEEAARRRGMTAEYRERQTLPATPMDDRIVSALEDAAQATGEPYMRMHSGAAHDTMCVADRVPTAMVFVPCKDGISHHPAEEANPADAALAAEIILNAIRALS